MFKVMIVDDDFMIADCLEEILMDAGNEVCGTAGNVADAIAIGELHHPDLGVIDLRLSDGEIGTSVASDCARTVASAFCTRPGIRAMSASRMPKGWLASQSPTRPNPSCPRSAW